MTKCDFVKVNKEGDPHDGEGATLISRYYLTEEAPKGCVWIRFGVGWSAEFVAYPLSSLRFFDDRLREINVSEVDIPETGKQGWLSDKPLKHP